MKILLIKSVTSILVFLTSIAPIEPAFAQTTVLPSNNTAVATPERPSGTSFGSGSDKHSNQLPIPGGMGSPVFQEQVAGSLTYQVHILGEVNKPGTYRISASTRLSEALDRAGGILDRGSTRRIQLRREGGGRQVDLLAFKQFGSLDNNPYLLDNDVIFVPLRGKVVEIEGTVKRPGVYELRSERTIEDLLRLAGNVTPGIEGQSPLKVIRFTGGEKRVIDVDNSSLERKAFILDNADVVVVPHVLTDKKKFDYNIAKLPGDNSLFYPSYDERVFVLGGVNKPGPLAFSPYYDVRQYLTLAGGITKLAKTRRIKVIDTTGRSRRVNNTTSINPGDTIIVPEKYMAPESFVTLVLGITASVLGITSAIVTLKK